MIVIRERQLGVSDFGMMTSVSLSICFLQIIIIIIIKIKMHTHPQIMNEFILASVGVLNWFSAVQIYQG